MVLGRNRYFTHLFQKFFHAQLAGQIDAQSQAVHEKSDQSFCLRTSSVGTRSANDQILLSGEPGEYRCPSCQNRHEYGATISVAQISEPQGQFTLNANRRITAHEILLWRPGAVGWQFK